MLVLLWTELLNILPNFYSDAKHDKGLLRKFITAFALSLFNSFFKQLLAQCHFRFIFLKFLQTTYNFFQMHHMLQLLPLLQIHCNDKLICTTMLRAFCMLQQFVTSWHLLLSLNSNALLPLLHIAAACSLLPSKQTPAPKSSNKCGK